VVTKQAKGSSEHAVYPPDLAKLLQVLASPERLDLLQALITSEGDPATLSEMTGIPVSAVRRHARMLVSAGLARSFQAEEGERYAADLAGVALLNGSLVQRLSGNGHRVEALAGSAVGDVFNVYSVDVPTAPGGCLNCANSGFVRSVLDDLDRVLVHVVAMKKEEVKAVAEVVEGEAAAAAPAEPEVIKKGKKEEEGEEKEQKGKK